MKKILWYVLIENPVTAEQLAVSLDQGDGTQEDIAKAKELIDKLAEYKPLAKVEEREEQNYNLIDNSYFFLKEIL